ncbi:hypothetical protein [Sphaerisporangium fuscum]|uniref:hypothetical protein n=1 Tax=Sphaerisporangium fuscum TaxID=2835868 RepID=UPI001BDC04B6|nr:hypothetical protein [Sphaerisporangium fuscum]
MKTPKRTLALATLSLAAAGTLFVPAAQAATGSANSCPTPSKAEMKRSHDVKIDKPARGTGAIKGLRVGHIPKGFTYGGVVTGKHDGAVEYGYQWGDDRANADPEQRSLWVRVVCWPDAQKLADLKKLPVTYGTFGANVKTAKIGGRQVLTKPGDGALGDGTYVGWVERKGVAITVMASTPLVPELDKIVKSITLP